MLLAEYRYSDQFAAVENRAIYTPFEISNFQVFSRQSKPFVSALIGGLLLGVHWFVVASILKSKRLRWMGLLGWFPVMVFLRWGANQIYWIDPLRELNSSQATTELSPISIADLIRQMNNQPSWPQYGVEAFYQMGLTLLAIAWLGWFGFRIGLKDGLLAGKGPPALPS